MSRSPERRTPLARRVAIPALILVTAAAGLWAAFGNPDGAADGAGAPAPATSPGDRMAAAPAPAGPTTAAPGGEPDAVRAATGAAPVTPAARPALSAAAQAVARQLDHLGDLPAGDAAVALGRQLEASATTATAPAYREALLRTPHAAVERAAIAALARVADGETMVALAGDYGDLPQERRGRILQVLEAAGNPAALDGLARIVAADTSEKRSPLVMSALQGAANIGTMESVNYLLGLAASDAPDLALMALERVPTRQGVAMIRAAADGAKDHAQLSPQIRTHLRRIADTAQARGDRPLL